MNKPQVTPKSMRNGIWATEILPAKRNAWERTQRKVMPTPSRLDIEKARMARNARLPLAVRVKLGYL